MDRSWITGWLILVDWDDEIIPGWIEHQTYLKPTTIGVFYKMFLEMLIFAVIILANLMEIWFSMFQNNKKQFSGNIDHWIEMEDHTWTGGFQGTPLEEVHFSGTRCGLITYPSVIKRGNWKSRICKWFSHFNLHSATCDNTRGQKVQTLCHV